VSDGAELWDRVRRRSAEPQRPLIERLRQFLAAQDNPHACQLSGIATDKPLDQDSAEQLETLVIAHYRNGKLSKLDCADWLRLIYVALKELQRHQVPVIHFTRLALAPAPEPSPFSPTVMQHAERFRHWQTALQRWILTASATTSRKEWQAAILLT
jgi:hypothetical protein